MPTAPDLVVEWSPDTDPFEEPVWVDITAYNRNGKCERGRSFEQNEDQAGTCTIDLDNRTRLFDPDNASGTYYGKILPGKRVRVSMGYYYETLRLAPTAYWRLGESSGAFTNLGSGASLNLTASGTDLSRAQTGALSGSTDKAVRLNLTGTGGNTYLGVAAYNADQVTTNTFTFVSWFKGTVTAANQTLWGRAAGTTDPRVRVLTTGNVALEQNNLIYTTAAQTTGINVLDGNWHMIAVTKNGTGTTDSNIYIDGVEANYSARNAYTFVNTSSAWWIGAWNFLGTPADDNQGTIDETTIWNGTALTAAQIARLYKAGKSSGEGVVFHGFAESWPQTWPEQGGGNDAVVPLLVTDLVGWVNSWEFEHGAYTREQLEDTPWLCWRMGDQPSQRYGQVVDVSGNHRHGIFDDGGGGEHYLDTGRDSLIAFENDGAMEWGSSEFDTGVVAFPGRTGLTDITVECWVQFPPEELAQPSTIWTHLAQEDTSGVPAHSGTHHGLRLKARDNPTALQLVYYDGADWIVGSVRGPEIFNSMPHHIAVTQNGTTFAVTLRIDGILATMTTATLSGSPLGNAPGFFVGSEGPVGRSDQTYPPNYESAQCQIDGVAVYNSVLSSSRIQAHHRAGVDPWKIDDTGTRIGRVLDWIGWSASDRDLDTGVTVFDAAAVEGNGIVPYIQQLVRSEGGRFFCAADLTPTFRNRHDQWLDTQASTVQATFTDTKTGSENGDDFVYEIPASLEFDRVFLRNRIIASTQQLKVTWENQTSIDAFGPHTQELSFEELRWWDLIGAAQSQIRRYSNPVSYTTAPFKLHPDQLGSASNRAASWGTLLRLDLGHRVTWVRNPATGSAISKTCRLEGIKFEWGDGQMSAEANISAAEIDSITVWRLDQTGLDEAKVVW